MTRNEATNKLLEIMEAVEDVGGSCDECPFHEIMDSIDYECPFRDCPEMWTV